MATANTDFETTAVRTHYRPWYWGVLLCVAVVVCYLPAVGSPWLFDSTKLATEPIYREVTPIWVALTRSSRSFTEWTFAVQHKLFGPSPLAYSLVNIGIHLLATLTLWGIVRRTLNRDGIAQPLRNQAENLAGVISLLWAIHPLQTQAVTYTIQRHESLMGAMFFLTLYCFIRGCQAERAAARWYLGAVAACVVGMASKTVMVTCPVVVLLYDFAFIRDGFSATLRRRGWVYLLLIGVAAWGMLDVRFALDPNRTDVQSAGIGLAVVTPWEYLRTQPQVILHYVRLVFWPDRLSIDYMWPIASSPWQIWGLGAVVSATILVGLFGLRYWPKSAFFILSFFVVLAPTSSIVPIRDLAVEHRMYVPSAALIALAVCGWWILADSLREPAARKLARLGLVVLVGVGLGGRTFLRNVDYRMPIKLWESVLRISPHNYRAHHVLGDYARDQRDLKLAEEHYQQSIALDASYPPARQALASLLAQQGKYEAAEREFAEAVRLDPRYGRAFDNWGNMYARRGDFARAGEKYEAAILAEPNLASAQMHLGMVRFQQRNYAAAKKTLEEAIRLSPNLWDAKLHLAMILSAAPDPSLHDPSKGLALAKSLTSSEHPTTARALHVLAMAQAANGQFPQALQSTRQARHLAMGINDQSLLDELEASEIAYRRQEPYRLAK